MAIEGPEAVDAAVFRPATQWRTAGGRLSCSARRPGTGRGRKSNDGRCGLGDRGAAVPGQIKPGERSALAARRTAFEKENGELFDTKRHDNTKPSEGPHPNPGWRRLFRDSSEATFVHCRSGGVEPWFGLREALLDAAQPGVSHRTHETPFAADF